MFQKISLFFFRKFHDLSLQLLNECYRADKYATNRLISVHIYGWQYGSCFRIMTLLDSQVIPANSELITHSSFQDILSCFWNGDLDIENSQAISYYSSPWLVSTFCVVYEFFREVKKLRYFIYGKYELKQVIVVQKWYFSIFCRLP